MSGAKGGFELQAIAAGLAFADAVPDVQSALERSPVVVVSAPPGSGKTTLVPAIVANMVRGRIIVTQPRRVAARAAARRLATLDGSGLGSRVGFTVRGERVLDDTAIVEMLTPGVLLRRLLKDPGLDGVGAVIIDEVHERALDTDLLIGLLCEVRELREDLVVVLMSATLDAARFAEILGGDVPAPIVSHEAVAHELTVRWAPPTGPRVDERGVTTPFLRHVAETAVTTHAEMLRNNPAADALVFAPGAREVAVIAKHLRGLAQGSDVIELHGQVSPREQDRAISGRSGQVPRIIVATSIAESSLTVPGVHLVVDTCLSRVVRRDAARGMSGLVTTAASRASATQRAGRATRLGPGTVVRCVDERTFAAAASYTAPEIATSDLTDAALILAVWGAPQGIGLRLPDAPPRDAMVQATQTLTALGALDAEGRATHLGRNLAMIPADPRIAHALHAGAELIGARETAEIIALIAADIRTSDADLAMAIAALQRGTHDQASAWRREVDRFARLASRAVPAQESGKWAMRHHVGLITALAFPDRIARRVSHGAEGSTYLLASGTRAGLTGSLSNEEWIVVADVTRSTANAAQGTGAVVRFAAALSEEIALSAGAGLVTDRVEASFSEGRVLTRRERRIGAIVRSSVPIPTQGDEASVEAVRRALDAAGIGLFSWSAAATELRNRLALVHKHLGEPWPDVSDAALDARLTQWLAPEISALAAGTPASRIDLLTALRRLLPWPEAARLDDLAPERITVPSGSRISVTYAEDADTQPVVAVKLQECFGLMQTPRLVSGAVPVLFHLLSPGGKPLAVTADLASFWAGPYAQVRAEMRGRYPKHPWPEDPHGHVATAKTNRRLNS